MKRIILITLWITFFEFLRNEILFKSEWVTHYKTLGLTFTTTPLNGILWMLWSALLAYLIITLRTHKSHNETACIAWLVTFPSMWIVLYNLQVLPLHLLLYAIPLSAIEVYVATRLVK